MKYLILTLPLVLFGCGGLDSNNGQYRTIREETMTELSDFVSKSRCNFPAERKIEFMSKDKYTNDKIVRYSHTIYEIRIECKNQDGSVNVNSKIVSSK